MSETKRLGLPILVMAVSTLLFYLLDTYINPQISVPALVIMFDISLFIFGITLNNKKKSHSVYRKVIALICAILLVFMQLGVVSLPFVETLKAFLTINPYLLSMLFVYFGFLFVD